MGALVDPISLVELPLPAETYFQIGASELKGELLVIVHLKNVTR